MLNKAPERTEEEEKRDVGQNAPVHDPLETVKLLRG